LSRFPFRPRPSAPPAPEGFTAALVENIADPVLACDAQGTIVMHNRRARELLGATTDPVPREQWTQRCPIYRPDGSQVTSMADLPLAHALRGEDVRDVQLEVRPNGRRHVMSVSGSPVRGPDGDIRGAVIVMNEITDRVEMEGRLRTEGAITANMATGIALMRAVDGEILYANQALERMHGYGPGELVGRQISELNAPGNGSPEEHLQSVLSGLARDGVWSADAPKLRRDGSVFWCAVQVSAFEHREHGTVWIVCQTDITGRKVAEEALRAADERLRSVFEDGPVGIVVIDDDLRMVDANKCFSEITGYRRDELVGRLYTAIGHPADLERENELAAKLVTGEVPRYRMEKRLATKDGEPVRVTQTTTLVRDADGHPLHRIAIVEQLEPA
jgi:PAS domain S-box-containing protein